MSRAVLATLFLGVAHFVGAAHAQVQFVEVSSGAGVTYQQQVLDLPDICVRDTLQTQLLMCGTPTLTGGVTVGDFDGDGWQDVYATRIGAPDLLFRNLGNGTFVDVAASAGLDASFNTNGAVFADLDNDGDQDLVVTTIAESRHLLYINDGAGHFTEEAVQRGTDLGSSLLRNGTSVSAGDYDRDGWLDLYLGEWSGKIDCEDGHAKLLHNTGSGYFEDVTLAAGVDQGAYSPFLSYVFSGTFVDLDEDGWLDLAVVADFGQSRLFWNNHDGTFSEGTAAAGVGLEAYGMGTAFGDYDSDGDLDWLVTSIEFPGGDGGNRLYRYEGGRTFSNVTDEVGVRNGRYGWGAAFFDSDLDGDLDIVETNGSQYTEFGPAIGDPSLYWRYEAGVYTEGAGAAGLLDTGQGKGLVTFDYDNDGDLDVLWANTGAEPRLFRNDSVRAGDWLQVSVRGNGSNRDGRHVRVEVRVTDSAAPLVRVIGVGEHLYGTGPLAAHFGLGPGSGTVFEVRAVWPTGESQTLSHVARNSSVSFQELGASAGGTHATYPPEADCNSNGVADECELDVNDCDGNDVVDSCDLAAGAVDCDGNGELDTCQFDAVTDCNTNDVLDVCEVTPVEDCDGNGRYDVCELDERDCNSNGVVDDCEVGVSNDCDANGVLDLCELNPSTDCNTTGVLDRCEVTPEEDCNDNGAYDSCELNAATDCNDSGVLDACEVTPEEDCDGNGRYDSCELSGLTDCDSSGVLDVCESDSANDCDGNSVLDVCEIATDEDCNGNDVLDRCDPDCDSNGVPDTCELTALLDCDANGILDHCEVVPDTDGDGVSDCYDLCPTDPEKVEPRSCGCGAPESVGCGERPPELAQIERDETPAGAGCTTGGRVGVTNLGGLAALLLILGRRRRQGVRGVG